jgi:hypothetical protein
MINCIFADFNPRWMLDFSSKRKMHQGTKEKIVAIESNHILISSETLLGM